MCLTMAGCSERQELAEGNAVYYWRTELRLDTTERAFLREYHISKVYCRYFDVVMDKDGEPMPNATITFTDTLPQGVELVPTVYITEDCMHEPHPGLAEKLVKRILQMNETNDISGVHEIQIDCDYTARSRQTYYDFLNEVNVQCSTFHVQCSTYIVYQLDVAPPPPELPPPKPPPLKPPPPPLKPPPPRPPKPPPETKTACSKNGLAAKAAAEERMP